MGEISELKMEVAALQRQLEQLAATRAQSANGSGQKSALAILQTVMLAALLASMALVGTTTMENAKRVERHQVLLDERGALLTRMLEVQTGVLKTLAQHNEFAALLEQRIKVLEKK